MEQDVAWGRRRVLGVAGAMLGVPVPLVMSACGWGERAAKGMGVLRAPLTYVALGASDAAGVGVEDPVQQSWVSVLARRLPQPTRLVNLGVPGFRLRDALEVELPPALEAQPQLVTVWLVVNDLLAGVPLGQYTADLDRLLATLQQRLGAKIALGNVPDAPADSSYLGMTAARRQEVTAQWNAAVEGVAQRHGVLLVDLFHRWPVAQHPDYIGPDGLHPTVEGYRTLAETFLTAMREARWV